jgi:hypothetical protein
VEIAGTVRVQIEQYRESKEKNGESKTIYQSTGRRGCQRYGVRTKIASQRVDGRANAK